MYPRDRRIRAIPRNAKTLHSPPKLRDTTPLMVQHLQPEQQAREKIDAMLRAAGWEVQNADSINLTPLGVAVREVKMKRGHGRADYLLFVNRKAVGAIEAKKVGETLSGVVLQSKMYSEGLPKQLTAPVRPLPFMYVSTGVETLFCNRLDPDPRSRRVFAFHRPETFAEWLKADDLDTWSKGFRPSGLEVESQRPSTFRSRLQVLPAPDIPGLWPNQVRAITNLEASLAANHPRALIQMATGSGKSKTAVAAIYRMIKFGGAKRVLFLVDRTNLGEQADTEFENYITYDDNRRFKDLYTVQLLQGNTIRSAASVVITTIQRLYSMLRGEELDPEVDEHSQFEASEKAATTTKKPLDVVYNPAISPEYFDVIVIDECHRSIYTIWRQVLDYFDAFLIGLTATPACHTFGFFNGNLVMEYDHDDAVADGVNVDYDIFRIRTQVTEQGSTIKAGAGVMVGKRDRRTRRQRWEQPDEDISYTANQLDRDVVALDQIRLVARTFKERLFTEMFPGRTTVPKTLVFAKDDSHAEDIVKIFREVFGRGDAFCKKITYKVTGVKPKDLIQDFRTAADFRIAVTVDMVATGTDIKPLEIVMFMRSVKSRVLYQQMRGRGVRVVDRNTLRGVTAEARDKTHFMLVDCVGVTETEMQDTRPLERKPGVSFARILDLVGLGSTDHEVLSSLASRLARLDKQCDADDRQRIRETGNVDLKDVTHAIVDALDLELQVEATRAALNLADDIMPTDKQIAPVAEQMLRDAVNSLASQPKLRKLLCDLKKQFEQIVDESTVDTLVYAGPSEEARKRAKALTQSFEEFLEQNKDTIDALQFFYSVPYKERLRFEHIQALADSIQAPPRQWTTERLWQAYERLDASKVKGAGGERLLTDVVSLIRYALHRDDELVPYAHRVHERYTNWLAQQQNKGRVFNEEQVRWLEMIRDHVARSAEVEIEDFDYTPFVEQGGLGKAGQVFAGEIGALVRELNEVLSA